MSISAVHTSPAPIALSQVRPQPSPGSEGEPGAKTAPGAPAEQAPEKQDDQGRAGAPEPSSEERREIEQLKQRDREVRAHEQAHLAAGAGYVRGGVSYSFRRGPDGRQYAVGGEVSIDTSKERDPAATLRKAETVKAAALAPANPSPQDMRIAAKAAQMAAQARQELAQQQREEAQGTDPAREDTAVGKDERERDRDAVRRRFSPDPAPSAGISAYA